MEQKLSSVESIKTVLEISQTVMKSLADIDYDVVNNDLPFHIARARAQQLIEDTLTQDRAQTLAVLREELKNLEHDVKDSGEYGAGMYQAYSYVEMLLQETLGESK